ncbi:MAG TPA: LPXTG cell wall anchor domain-containing protein [Methanotrichaceae archaeon]|nr:LPXTG cell wall anchor domain-containing protein [Methanotrichaceae archaeon]
MKAHILAAAALLMVLVLGQACASYDYHMPVNIQATITPSVLMPGDSAVVAIEMQNGAADYGVGKEATGLILSTPINSTKLIGTDQITVTSNDYKDLGMIGPDDKVTVYYKIKASDDIPNGTYFLDFNVQGGYDMIQINRKIPVQIDSSPVSLARAEVPTKPSISLNVANPRGNTINAVTIKPSSPGIRFSPEEYYIGTMDSDEVFTINFGIDSDRPINSPVKLNFTSVFKNGETWHQSEAYATSYVPPKTDSNTNGMLIPAGIVAVLAVLGGGVYLYRRKKASNKQA